MLDTRLKVTPRWESQLRQVPPPLQTPEARRSREALPARIWDVAIVGLGPAGLAALLGLLRSAQRPLSVLLIDPAERPGGDAYRRSRPEHLLNARATSMSVDPDDPDSFARWLAKRLHLTPEEARETYAPRPQFAAYLDQMRARAFSHARGASHRLYALRRAVVDVDATERGWRVALDDGDSRLARHLLLAPGCVGRTPSAQPVSTRVAASPWTADYELAARRFGPGTALIVGGGLSGVDAALSLATAGWRGPIVIASPDGTLPASHAPGPAAEARIRPLPTPLPRRASQIFAALRASVDAHREAGVDWRASFQQLRDELPEVWPTLDSTVRRRLIRRAGRIWNRHRHRIAPEAASRLEAMVRSRQLTVERRRVLGVREEDGRVSVDVRAPHGDAGTIGVDYLVMATGLDLGPRAHPLIARLIDRGLAHASGTGYGLAVERVGTAVSRRQGVGSIHVLGSSLFGERLETTAVRELTAHARFASVELAAVLAHDPNPSGRAGHVLGAASEPLFACD